MTENEQQTIDLAVGPLGSFDDAVAFGDALYALEGVTRLALNEFDGGHASFTFTVRSVEAVRDGLLMMPEFSVASVDRADDGVMRVAIGERPYDAYVAEHASSQNGYEEAAKESGFSMPEMGFRASEIAGEPEPTAHEQYAEPVPSALADMSGQPYLADSEQQQAAVAMPEPYEPASAALDQEYYQPQPAAPEPATFTAQDPFRPSVEPNHQPPEFPGAQPSVEQPEPSFEMPLAPPAQDDFPTVPAAEMPIMGEPRERGEISGRLIDLARELRDKADELADLAMEMADHEQPSAAAETVWEADSFSMRSWENEEEAAPQSPAPAAEQTETAPANEGWAPAGESAWTPVEITAQEDEQEEERGWEAPQMPSVGAMAPAPAQAGEGSPDHSAASAQAVALATAMGRKPSQVHLLASGFASFGIANSFIAAVRQIAGVRNVAISELDQGRLRLSLDYFGSESLEQQLQQLTEFPHEIVRASGKEIEIQLQAA